MDHLRRSGFFPLALILVFAAVPPSAIAQIEVFSTGQFGTPETISLAPAGFGSFAGSFFIPDARVATIWTVPAVGGPPSMFLATPIDGSVRGGFFVPESWGGPDAGKFLTAGLNVNVYDPLGFRESFQFIDPVTQLPVVAASNFTTPVIAPPEFGTFGGHLFVSDQNIQIWQANPGTNLLTSFLNLRDACPSAQQNDSCPFWNLPPFGIEFTPPSWGSFANQLLVANAGAVSHDDGTPFLDGNGSRYSEIVAVGPDGSATVFADIPLRGAASDPDVQQQNGLRQILMLPPDFLVPSLGADGAGQLLLVSISGSGQGGGVLGETLALDASGQIKAHLITGSTVSKFDPRGMLLTADNHILISDTSDPILRAAPTDFAPGRGAVCSVISAVSTSTLWPPNHDLVNVGLMASSSCPAAVSVAVYSNEDETADTGDGNFSPDATGSTPASLRLRAERSGSGAGRIYLIVVTSTDSAGAVAPSCDTVTVAHSNSKKDADTVAAMAATAMTFCQQNAGAAPAGYSPVGDGPVIGSKQ